MEHSRSTVGSFTGRRALQPPGGACSFSIACMMGPSPATSFSGISPRQPPGGRSTLDLGAPLQAGGGPAASTAPAASCSACGAPRNPAMQQPPGGALASIAWPAAASPDQPVWHSYSQELQQLIAAQHAAAARGLPPSPTPRPGASPAACGLPTSRPGCALRDGPASIEAAPQGFAPSKGAFGGKTIVQPPGGRSTLNLFG